MIANALQDQKATPTREPIEDQNLTTENQKIIHHNANVETKSDDHLVDLTVLLLDPINPMIHLRLEDFTSIDNDATHLYPPLCRRYLLHWYHQ